MSEKTNIGLENLIAPERLTNDKANKIAKKIADERLCTNENEEYFTIHLDGKVVHIPKRETIHIQDKLGQTSRVEIDEYIRSVIDEYDAEAEKNL